MSCFVLYEREEIIVTAYLIVCPLVFLAGLAVFKCEATANSVAGTATCFGCCSSNVFYTKERK